MPLRLRAKRVSVPLPRGAGTADLARSTRGRPISADSGAAGYAQSAWRTTRRADRARARSPRDLPGSRAHRRQSSWNRPRPRPAARPSRRIHRASAPGSSRLNRLRLTITRLPLRQRPSRGPCPGSGRPARPPPIRRSTRHLRPQPPGGQLRRPRRPPRRRGPPPPRRPPLPRKRRQPGKDRPGQRPRPTTPPGPRSPPRPTGQPPPGTRRAPGQQPPLGHQPQPRRPPQPARPRGRPPRAPRADR